MKIADAQREMNMAVCSTVINAIAKLRASTKPERWEHLQLGLSKNKSIIQLAADFESFARDPKNWKPKGEPYGLG